MHSSTQREKTMTKKDYIAIARILSGTKMPQILWTRLVLQFIELYADNPGFDWERFKKACQPRHGFPAVALTYEVNDGSKRILHRD